MDTVVNFNCVSFMYEDNTVLDGADFSIGRLEHVSIIGPNGGGKSTLLKLMLGLLQPVKGKVAVLGKSPQEARRQIGYMPQYSQFDTLFPVTVLDVVLMGMVERSGFGGYRKKHKVKALAALAEMGMQDVAKEQFSSLSGGQRQRVLIARAIVGEPEILLLDEPTNNIDPAMEKQFYETVSRLAKRMTVITVSHDLGFVSANVDKVICVNRFVRIHPVADLDSALIDEVYGSPHKIVRHDKCSGGHVH